MCAFEEEINLKKNKKNMWLKCYSPVNNTFQTNNKIYIVKSMRSIIIQYMCSVLYTASLQRLTKYLSNNFESLKDCIIKFLIYIYIRFTTNAIYLGIYTHLTVCLCISFQNIFETTQRRNIFNNIFLRLIT